MQHNEVVFLGGDRRIDEGFDGQVDWGSSASGVAKRILQVRAILAEIVASGGIGAIDYEAAGGSGSSGRVPSTPKAIWAVEMLHIVDAIFVEVYEIVGRDNWRSWALYRRGIVGGVDSWSIDAIGEFLNLTPRTVRSKVALVDEEFQNAMVRRQWRLQ